MPINTPAELEAKLIELSPILHEKFNVSKIGYFGSFARNQQTADSDIDILVESPEAKDIWILKDELSELFGRKVDVVEKDRILTELRDSILEDVRFVNGSIIVGPTFPQPGESRYMKQKRHDIYLKDILENLKSVIEFVGEHDLETLSKNKMAILAIERCLSIIGEAAGKIPKNVREKYPEVPWTSMINLRNVVVHDYDGIDYTKIWNTIKNDIPQNIIQMERILELENRFPV